jgi:AcrR family transcriptional regulator
MTEETDGRRLRGTESRRRITTAVRDLFAEGYRRPGIATVARSARVSPRTVFQHWRSLIDLYVEALGPEGVASFVAELRAMPDDDLARAAWADLRTRRKK